MYSFPDLEPVYCSISSTNCCFLSCIQISLEAGQMIWYSHLLKNFLHFLVIHRVKWFSTVNKTEVHAFLELTCFFYDPEDVDNLISGSSAFSKSSLNIWSSWFMYSWSLAFEHYFASMWDVCHYVVVWTFFGIAFLWNRKESWPFPVLWPLVSFPDLLAYWVQHFHSIIFEDLK